MKGDFLGFSFNGVHSSDMNLTRVSDGDRYKDSLPEIEDKTIEIPGLDGSYFYGSNFKNRSFSISVAFDHMTETNMRLFKQTFGYKHTGLLVFDEAPYKQYRVKVASPPELDFVCFDERKKHEGETTASGVRVVEREYHEGIPATYESVYENDLMFSEGEDNTCTVTVINSDLYDSLEVGDVVTVTVGDIQSKGNIVTNENDDKILEGNSDNISFSVTGLSYECSFSVRGVSADEYNVKIEKQVTEEVPPSVDITREEITPWELDYEEGTNKPLYERIYKGEGTIEFVAYYPFAKMTTKFADEYDNENKNEWLSASGLKDSTWFTTQNVDEYVDSAGAINVYNPGDIETGFKLFIPFDANGTIPTFTLTYKDQVLNISKITRKEENVMVNGNAEPGSIGIQINTDNGLIEGIWKRTSQNNQGINDIFVTSGQIYNECATGEFFKIQPSDQIQKIGITINPGDMEIYYDYLYF